MSNNFQITIMTVLSLALIFVSIASIYNSKTIRRLSERISRLEQPPVSLKQLQDDIKNGSLTELK